MSNANDFTSGGVEIGQLTAFVSGASPVQTVSGKDYLITGALAAITSYPTLEALFPWLCTAMATATKRSTGGGLSHIGVVYAGTTYYMCSGSEVIKQSTDTTTWGAVTGATTINTPTDLVQFGAFAMWSDSTATSGGYISGSVATLTTGNTASSTAIAVNTAGTLGVFLQSATSCVTATTANGTWTTRASTQTDTATNHIRWSQAGSRFIKLSTAAHAWTNTDGFTDTDRGAISGLASIDVIPPATGFKSRYSAATASATVFACMATPTGASASVPHIIRTADGAAFTATPVSSLAGVRIGNLIPSIVNINEVLYLYSNPQNFLVTGYILKSSDHGATWVRCPVPSSLAYAANPAAPVSTITYANSIIFGVTISGSTNVVSSYAAGMPATHVGIAKAEDAPVYNYSAGTNMQAPLYVRVK